MQQLPSLYAKVTLSSAYVYFVPPRGNEWSILSESQANWREFSLRMMRYHDDKSWWYYYDRERVMMPGVAPWRFITSWSSGMLWPFVIFLCTSVGILPTCQGRLRQGRQQVPRPIDESGNRQPPLRRYADGPYEYADRCSTICMILQFALLPPRQIAWRGDMVSEQRIPKRIISASWFGNMMMEAVASDYMSIRWKSFWATTWWQTFIYQANTQSKYMIFFKFFRHYALKWHDRACDHAYATT